MSVRSSAISSLDGAPATGTDPAMEPKTANLRKPAATGTIAALLHEMRAARNKWDHKLKGHLNTGLTRAVKADLPEYLKSL